MSGLHPGLVKFFSFAQTLWHTNFQPKAWEGATHSSPFKLPWVMLKAGSGIHESMTRIISTSKAFESPSLWPILLARFPKPGVQKTLKEMKSLGVAPDRVSFNSAIATGVKAPRGVVGSVF